MLQIIVLLLATILMPMISTIDNGALRQITHCTLRDSGEIGNADNDHPQNWQYAVWMWPDGEQIPLTGGQDDLYAVRNFIKTRGFHTEGEVPPTDVELIGTMLADVRGDDSDDWDVTLKVFAQGNLWWIYRSESGCMINSGYLGRCWRQPDPDYGYWDVPERVPFDRTADYTGFCYEYQP